MARSSSSPSGETKTPLVVALVFFVLATIAMGVMYYTTAEDLEKARAESKASVEKEKAAQVSLAKTREELLIHRAAMGLLGENESLEGLTYKKEAQDIHRALMEAIGAKSAAAITNEAKRFGPGTGTFNLVPTDLLDWPWPADGAITAPNSPRLGPDKLSNTIIDRAVAFMATQELNTRYTKNEQKTLKDNTQIMQQKTNEHDDAVKKLKAEAEKYPKELEKEVAVARENYDKRAAGFGEAQADSRKRVEDANSKAAAMELQTKRLNEVVTIQNRKIEELLDKQTELIDPFQFDKPQGRILRRYSDSLVDIDLGTSDKLRAGIAFSIFPSDTIFRGMQPRMRPFTDAEGKVIYRPIPKGKIEVIEVIGANIAQCRIIDEDNAVRDRIIPGDLLYNAVWRKGSSEHVALFGVFDLDGDGRDDIQALITGLRRVGVVVDAYYDLTKMKWEGEVTSLTNFGIEGYYPTVSAADGNRESKMRILNGIGDARKAIKEKGIMILRPRDVFPRVGFNARLDVNQDAINQAATGLTRATYDDKKPAAPEGAPAPADPNAKPPEPKKN